MHGTSKSDTATTAALKENGFKWSSNLGAWYLPRTWGEPTRELRVRALESKLGDQITVKRGDLAKTGTAEQRVAAKMERTGQLAEHHAAKAEKLSGEASAQFGKADRISSHIPMGQPILVGHHSESRHRRDLGKIDTAMRKGSEAHSGSKEAAARASAAEHRAATYDNPVIVQRRLDRNEAQLRSLERKIQGTGKAIHGEDTAASGQHAERLKAMHADLAGTVARDRQVLEQHRAAGTPVHDKSTVAAGDFVRIRGQLHMVEKANPKTVTIKSHGLTLKYPYGEVTKHAKADALLSTMTADTLKQLRDRPGTPAATVAAIDRELARKAAHG